MVISCDMLNSQILPLKLSYSSRLRLDEYENFRGNIFELQHIAFNYHWITIKIDIWWIQKVSIPIHFIHGTRRCIQKNPNFTHLEHKHFFGNTLYIECDFALICWLRLANIFFGMKKALLKYQYQVSILLDKNQVSSVAL